MKLYLAGERLATTADISSKIGEAGAAIWTKYVKRRLFSFYYHGYGKGTGLSEAVADCKRMGLDLFLDSGAFTAFTKKTKIPLKEYADFINATSGVWTVASSLDAIGSGEEAASASYENFARLRSYGAKVAPVFHIREPDHWLQRYVDEGHDYIFIGGMVPETIPWLLVRLDHLFASVLTRTDGTAKVRLHGFGLTSERLMFRYPWYSVDSTRWLMAGIFGFCLFRVDNKLVQVVFSEDSPDARKFKGRHYRNLTPEGKAVVDGWLEPYGVTPDQLATHYSFRDVVNAAVFQGLEDLGVTTFSERQRTLF